jgi:branched-chain amino acid transport system substrate-binding protein
LVIEQARELGYKGGFILIDQAKMDYIANILKGTQLLGGSIGIAAVAQTPIPGTPGFDKKYVSTYKRMLTWEAAMNYDAMHALARAMVAAGTVSDPAAIRAAFSKAFPLTGEKFPIECFGVTPGGWMEFLAAVQTIDNRGEYSPVRLCGWWLKDEDAFNKLKTQVHLTRPVDWMFLKLEKDQ